MEQVILVDEQDREIGTAEKLAAHRDGGQLHRAFSIFLFDEAGRMLVQRRAAAKYHFPRLRTNACCSHPRPGEAVEEAALRRMREELGVVTELRKAFTFIYEARDETSGLTEREFDHVFIGRLQGEPAPDPAEIESVHWVEPARLMRDVFECPDRYTPWFKAALPRLDAMGLLG